LIVENQKVDIYDINNGAAARKAYKGDKIIICAYGYCKQEEVNQHTPVVVHVDELNRINTV